MVRGSLDRSIRSNGRCSRLLRSVTGFRRLPYGRRSTPSTTRVPAPWSALPCNPPARSRGQPRRPSALQLSQHARAHPFLPSLKPVTHRPARRLAARLLFWRAGRGASSRNIHASAARGRMTLTRTRGGSAGPSPLPSWRTSIIGIKKSAGGSAGGRMIMAPCIAWRCARRARELRASLLYRSGEVKGIPYVLLTE